MSERIVCQQPHFAEGRFRYVYKGRRDSNLSLWRVVKVFKEGCPTEVADLQPDLDVYERTHDFARLWNQRVVPYHAGAEGIHYFTPAPYRHPAGDAKVFRHVRRQGQCSIEEPFIHGHYQKFNSNAGMEKAGYPTIGAFSHWTYETTGHKYMVCDLQGVHKPRDRPPYFRLTDACVHSFTQEHRGALTDLGVVGMEKVLAGHRCNFLCRALGLPEAVVPRHLAREEEFTHYSSSTDLSAAELRRARDGRSKYVKPQAPILEEDEEEEDDVHQLARLLLRILKV